LTKKAALSSHHIFIYEVDILKIVVILFMLIVLTNVTVITTPPRSALSTGALAGIVLGTIAGAVASSAIVSILILRAHTRKYHAISRRRHCEYLMSIILGCLGGYFMIFHYAYSCVYYTS
jgi:membrane protein implicated in regulation of membrane protease activity